MFPNSMDGDEGVPINRAWGHCLLEAALEKAAYYQLIAAQ